MCYRKAIQRIYSGMAKQRVMKTNKSTEITVENTKYERKKVLKANKRFDGVYSFHFV